MNYVIISLAVSALVAFFSVHWAYFRILRIAKTKNLTDCPDPRKLQKVPVPLMGGIAVFFGLAAGLMMGDVMRAIPFIVAHTAVSLSVTDIFPLLCAMVIMLYLGALDDIIGLSPKSRLVFEVLTVFCIILPTGCCIDNFRGVWGIYQISWWIAVPLTVFAGVGIINAVNMIDGVNGLSSGLCIVYSLTFGFIFYKVGDLANAVLAISVAGAMLPFLLHNVFGQRSRMFIGDAGTMVMGILMLWFVMCVLNTESPLTHHDYGNTMCMIAFSLAVLSVPVFDTLRVMTMRMLHGKSPFNPDKTHLHHIFIRIGISHAITSLSEIIIDVVVVFAWAVSYKLGASVDVQLYVTVAVAACLVWGTYAILIYHANHHTSFLHILTAISIRTHLGRTEWWKKFTYFLDRPEDKYILAENQKTAVENVKATAKEPIDPNDFKEADRKKILEYIKGRSEVYVDDILNNSGAEPLRVYSILFEEEKKGRVIVIKRYRLGVPEIVALVEIT